MPPSWDLLTTPGHRRSPRSSSSSLRRGRSNHRRWRLAPGIHQLVAPTRKKREGGKGVAKQPWVLIQSTRKHQIYNKYALVSNGRFVSVDWTAECQNGGEGLAYQRLASSSSSKHLAACRRVKNSILYLTKHVVASTPRDPSPTPYEKAILEPHVSSNQF